MGCLAAFVQRLKVALDKITTARASVVNAAKVFMCAVPDVYQCTYVVVPGGHSFSHFVLD